MPRSTIGGDDPAHKWPKELVDEKEAEWRKLAREKLRQKKAKESSELNNRATNVSREASKRAQHH